MVHKVSFLTSVPGGVTLAVRVQPRSSKRGPVGFWGEGGEYLKWMVSAAPTDGEANQELQIGIAKIFSIAKSRVQIVQGESQRLKLLRLEGVSVKEVQSVLKELGILTP